MSEIIDEYGGTLVEAVIAIIVLRLLVVMITSPSIGGFRTFFEVFVKSLAG